MFVTERDRQPIAHLKVPKPTNGADAVRYTIQAMWELAIVGFATYLRAANRSRQTIRLRTYWVTRFSNECRADDPLLVGPDVLLEWVGNDAWSAETRKSARASLVAFYHYLVETDRISELQNPARRLPKVTPARAVPRPAPDQVLRDALWQASDRDRLIIMHAAYAGMRRAEIAQVHSSDYRWDTGEILVHGKGEHERLVPLHPDLAILVRAELARRSAGTHGTGYRFDSGCRADGYMFPGKNGHLIPDTVGKVLVDLLAGPWTGHTLRHRFATTAYAAERDLRAVQELLGHSKPETTARYVQTPTEAKRAAVLGVGVRDAA